MKIEFVFNGSYLGAPAPKEYDGKKSYSVSVMVNGEVGSLKCEEHIHQRATDGEFAFGETVKCHAVYNSDYRSLKIDKMKKAESK